MSRRTISSLLALSSILAVGMACCVGATDITLLRALSILIKPDTSIDSLIIWEIRLPRTLAAYLVGGMSCRKRGRPTRASEEPTCRTWSIRRFCLVLTCRSHGYLFWHCRKLELCRASSCHRWKPISHGLTLLHSHMG